MKKRMIAALLLTFSLQQVQAQSTALQAPVSRLDKARTAKDYEALEKEFAGIAATQKTDWLPYYYAALCNARIGFLYQDDGEKIEPYSNRGEEEIKKAQSLLREATQKKELAEVYTVMSMIYRTKVFINPMTYGRKYGPISQQYLDQAKLLDAQNPRALWLQAWVKYNTPKMWGGDKKQAKELATESLRLLGQTPAGTDPHWGKTEDEELLGKYK